MRKLKRLFKKVGNLWHYDNFMNITEGVETIVAKVLTIALLIVILVALVNLVIVLGNDLFAYNPSDPDKFFRETLLELFGLFLNILIALELLDNITAYLRKHIFQVELVIATSLIAIARKIIIFDFNQFSGNKLIALAIAIFALSVSYWLVRKLNQDIE